MEIQTGTIIANNYRVVGPLRMGGRSFLLSGPGDKKFALDLYDQRGFDSRMFFKGALKAYEEVSPSDLPTPAVRGQGQLEELKCSYLIRDFREGVLLSELKQIDFSVFVKAFRAIFLTLKVYESKGLFHGNVQPGAILIDAGGNDPASLIYPFGFGTTLSGQIKSMFEDKAFLPPEEIDMLYLSPRRDVYGAGATLRWFLVRHPKDVQIDGLTDGKQVEDLRIFCETAMSGSERYGFRSMHEMSKAFEGGYAARHL